MGEPKVTNNVRRIDFAKAAAKPRPRGEVTEAGQPVPGRGSHLKVVALPDARSRRGRRSHRSPQNAMMVVIVILAALLGALTAVVILDTAF